MLACYGRTFNPVEHINPLMVLEGGKASHSVLLREDPSHSTGMSTIRTCGEEGYGQSALSQLYSAFAAAPLAFDLLFADFPFLLRFLFLVPLGAAIHLYKICGFWLWLEIGIQ